MQVVRVRNVTRGVDLATGVAVAASPWRRFVGLMGKRDLPAGGGLIIRPCNSIHMFFMRMPLDVLYCGASGPAGDPVLRVLAGIKPWRLGPIVRGSKYVLELPAGTVARTGTQQHDIIQLEPSVV
jgi:uncharacterized membrane protein (UPF0127 family)